MNGHCCHPKGCHTMGRHGANPFGGPRGGGFGHGRFMGGDGFPGGRKLSATDLQLVLLALLDEQPAHGYELIRLLEERSGGFYTPSPGMIYPALTYLEEIGYTLATPDGARKEYALTEAGKQHLEAHREQATAMIEALARIGARMGDVREAFAGLADMDPQAADELHAARHALKHALMRKRGCNAAEAQRISQIIHQAIQEIEGTKVKD